jgi:hypothetical protein
MHMTERLHEQLHEVLVASGVPQDLGEPHGRTNWDDELFAAQRHKKGANNGSEITGETAQNKSGDEEHEPHVQPTCDGDYGHRDNAKTE